MDQPTLCLFLLCRNKSRFLTKKSPENQRIYRRRFLIVNSNKKGIRDVESRGWGEGNCYKAGNETL